MSAVLDCVSAEVTPRHQWTHDGAEVLLLRFVDRDGTSYGGFRWPLTIGAVVEAPDWDPAPRCGGGLHGWPWGFSLGEGKDPDWSATWMVVGAAPADVVLLEGGMVKAPRVTIRYVGNWAGATAFVLAGQVAWVHHAARGAASATGGSSAASATGAASAAVVTGVDGRAKGGPWSAIALAYENTRARPRRVEMRCARIGKGDGSDGLLKANVWYVLNGRGEFIAEDHAHAEATAEGQQA